DINTNQQVALPTRWGQEATLLRLATPNQLSQQAPRRSTYLLWMWCTNPRSSGMSSSGESATPKHRTTLMSGSHFCENLDFTQNTSIYPMAFGLVSTSTSPLLLALRSPLTKTQFSLSAMNFDKSSNQRLEKGDTSAPCLNGGLRSLLVPFNLRHSPSFRSPVDPDTFVSFKITPSHIILPLPFPTHPSIRPSTRTIFRVHGGLFLSFVYLSDAYHPTRKQQLEMFLKHIAQYRPIPQGGQELWLGPVPIVIVSIRAPVLGLVPPVAPMDVSQTRVQTYSDSEEFFLSQNGSTIISSFAFHILTILTTSTAYRILLGYLGNNPRIRHSNPRPNSLASFGTWRISQSRWERRRRRNTFRPYKIGRRAQPTHSAMCRPYTENSSIPAWLFHRDERTSPAWRPCSESAIIVHSYLTPRLEELRRISVGGITPSHSHSSDPSQVQLNPSISGHSQMHRLASGLPSSLRTSGELGGLSQDGRPLMEKGTSDGQKQLDLSSWSTLSSREVARATTLGSTVTTKGWSKDGGMVGVATRLSTGYSSESIRSSQRLPDQDASIPRTFPARTTPQMPHPEGNMHLTRSSLHQSSFLQVSTGFSSTPPFRTQPPSSAYTARDATQLPLQSGLNALSRALVPYNTSTQSGLQRTSSCTSLPGGI
ncbi:hypothetical protein JAAARDRAFT_712706, partial [Jaapia argillacea MUCL 33604]